MTSGELSWISEARIVAEVTRSKRGGPIHVIGGPQEARVTIYAQQCRAINLVCALLARDPELTERRIAVVGAGAAGMTAASALLALGLPEDRLTIYERAASPLYTQRWSYSRFLHPRLFHWPEAGWRNGTADLPVGGWQAAYAAWVREQILERCVDMPIEFCTEVRDVRPRGPERAPTEARVCFSRLHDDKERQERFDVVLLACGFPIERRVPNTLGGTYWHGVDGLDDLRGEVHVVGDGDGALTEVLMLLIHRFGHAAVERLCELLPPAHLEELHAADLKAQGNPRAEANPSRVHARSRELTRIFAYLTATAPYPRSVVIHAERPLSGVSFLLNRVLVSHLCWGRRRLVELKPGRISEQEAGLMGNVIWRVGVGSLPVQPLAEARMTSRGLLRACEPANPPDPLGRGLLVGLLDGLRRPMWTDSAVDRMQRGLVVAQLGRLRGWREPVGPLHDVAAQPTPEAESLLQLLAATKRELEQLGLGTGSDVLSRRSATWVSIDLLARAGSCPHSELVQQPAPPTAAESLRSPRSANPSAPPVLRRDEMQRLWFALPDGRPATEPTRAAVCAMVDPARIAGWARELRSRADARESDDRRAAGLSVSGNALRGLSDVAGTDADVQLLLAGLHEERGEWDWARTAYVRAARMPGGRRLGAGGRPDETTPMNEVFRRVLLRLARAVARMRPAGEPLAEHSIWLLLSAAAADLVTLADSESVLLELHATSAFLTREWAPRVRALLGGPAARRTREPGYTHPPAWADGLAAAGVQLPAPARTGSRDDRRNAVVPAERIAEIRELAGEAARQGHRQTPGDALVTLPELGVWPAGIGLDDEPQDLELP